MKILTVFTPTFNRAHTLPRVYESLLAQTNDDFLWLIVDDGSTDDTEELVRGWVAEGLLDIRYIKQKNKGMLGAHNTALRQLDTELFVCLDSDDYFLPHTVTTILDEWSTYGADDRFGGLVGLDIFSDGTVVGDVFPENLEWTTFSELRFKLKVSGDKKYIHTREALRMAGLYPEIENEKYPAITILYRCIDRSKWLRVINKPLCVVEYQNDGNTSNKIAQYFSSPNAFMQYRLSCMDMAVDTKEKIMAGSHFVSSCFISYNFGDIFRNRHRRLTISVLPLGFFLFLYLKILYVCGVRSVPMRNLKR